MKTFKALRIHEVDKGTEARLESIGLGDLSVGGIVVRIAYSCINYKDALAVTGRGKIMRGYPKVAGIDLSGTVESCESDAFKPGDPVLVTGCNIGEVLDGGLAEYARLPAEAVIPLPAGLTLREAMALGTAGFTAALGVRRMLENHQKPEMGTIAVTGPTGGVGSVAISILSQLGFKVAAVTGKKAAAQDYLTALGASEVIDRAEVDYGNRPLEKAIWGGAIDTLGGDTLTWLTRTTRQWGNIASIGLAQSHKLDTTVMPFILRGVSLLGINSVEVPRAWREAVWQDLAGTWKPERLNDRIASRTVSLEQVPEVCAALIEGDELGRTVVEIGGG